MKGFSILTLCALMMLCAVLAVRGDQHQDKMDEHGYHTYTDWTECTAKCGGGLSFRVRECTDLSGDPECEESESKECNTQPCGRQEPQDEDGILVGERRARLQQEDGTMLMNGGDHKYTEYSDWSECTATCGGGLSFMVRECKDLTGDPDCEKSKSKACNTQPCGNDMYTEYGEWSECTVSCGGGLSFMVKECKDLTGEPDCEKSKSKKCNTQPCDSELASLVGDRDQDIAAARGLLFIGPAVGTEGQEMESDGKYTAYGEWSECTVTCGGGVSYMVKECKDRTGKPDCEKAKSKECNTQPCETAPASLEDDNHDIVGGRKLLLGVRPPVAPTSESTVTDIFDVQEGEVEGRYISSRLPTPPETTTKKNLPTTDQSAVGDSAGGKDGKRTSATRTTRAPSTKPVVSATTKLNAVATRGQRVLATTRPKIVSTRKPTVRREMKCGYSVSASSTRRLVSQDFANKPYSCEWKITATAGKQIKAMVSLYNSAACCDHLEVYDGGRRLGRINGKSSMPKAYLTNSSTLVLKFRSSGGQSVRRLRVMYRSLEREGDQEEEGAGNNEIGVVGSKKTQTSVKKCGTTLPATPGVQEFKSPNFKKNAAYDCEWTIKAPEGCVLHVRVFYFNNADCCDSLEVRNGQMLVERLTEKGYTQRKYMTQTRTLTMKFKSQGGTGDRRFRLVYIAVPERRYIPARPVARRPYTVPRYGHSRRYGW